MRTTIWDSIIETFPDKRKNYGNLNCVPVSIFLAFVVEGAAGNSAQEKYLFVIIMLPWYCVHCEPFWYQLFVVFRIQSRNSFTKCHVAHRREASKNRSVILQTSPCGTKPQAWNLPKGINFDAVRPPDKLRRLQFITSDTHNVLLIDL
jgi:hypothetical protein